MIPTSKIIFEISQVNASSTPLWQEGETIEGRKCQFDLALVRNGTDTLTITGSNGILLRCSRKQGLSVAFALRAGFHHGGDGLGVRLCGGRINCLHHHAHHRLGATRAQKHAAVLAERLLSGGHGAATSALPSTACLSFTRTLIRVCGIFSMT